MIDILVKSENDQLIQAMALDENKSPIMAKTNGRLLNNHALMLILKGEGTFEDTDTPNQRVGPGTVFFLYPGKWHNFDPKPDTTWTEYWVLFNGALVDSCFGNVLPASESPIYQLESTADVKDDFEELNDVWLFRNPGYLEYSRFLFHKILISVFLQIHNLSFQRQNDLIAKAKNAMRVSMFEEFFDFKSFAEKEKTSYENLRKQFKQHSQLSPHQYFLTLKVSKAKQLLLNPTLSVKQIAQDLGFSDPYYFSRLFKKKTGVSPNHFRKYFQL